MQLRVFFKKMIGVLSFIKEEISIYNLGITKSKPDIKKRLTGKRETEEEATGGQVWQ
jgi:hypothetical protein